MRRIEDFFHACPDVGSASDLAPMSAGMEQIWRLNGFAEQASLDDPADRAKAAYWFVSSFRKSRAPWKVPIPADLIRWMNVPVLDMTESFSEEPVPGGLRKRLRPRCLTRFLLYFWSRHFRDKDVFTPLGYYEFLSWLAVEASVDWNLPASLIPDDLIDLLNQPAIDDSQPLTIGMYVLSRASSPARFDSKERWSREDILAASYEGLTRLVRAGNVRLLPDYVTSFWSTRPFPDSPLQSSAEPFLSAFEYTSARVHEHGSGVLESCAGFVHQQELTRLWFLQSSGPSAPGSLLFSGFTAAEAGDDDKQFELSEPPETAVVSYWDRHVIAGLSRAAQAAVEGLTAAGYSVAELDYSLPRSRMQAEADFNESFLPFAQRQVHLFNFNPEYVPECVGINLARFQKDDYLIGQFYWELSSISRVHECGLQMMDEVWVASEYLRALYSRFTSRPVVNVRQAVVPRRVVARFDRAHFSLPPRSFLFLLSFDATSGVCRKNPLGAVIAFQKAFPGNAHDVGLVIKTRNTSNFNNDYDAMDWSKVRKAAASDSRIQIVDSTLTDYELTGLMNSCDVVVSLHKSEGFGFGPAEAMALGKPVIVTNYSGVTDFCTEKTALLVDFEEVEIPEGIYPLMDPDRTYRWAEPNLASAAEAFRTVYTDRALASRIGAAGQQLIRSEYSVEALSRRYRNRLSQLGFQPAQPSLRVPVLA